MADREDLRAVRPATGELTSLHSSGHVRGVIVTVKGSSSADGDDGCSRYDFGSRYFAPWVGVSEDPATGRRYDLYKSQIPLRYPGRRQVRAGIWPITHYLAR